jgi:hypothetical protein
MGDNVMLKMGSDFHYQSAIIWYKSLDKLIDSVMNKRPDLNLFYSTPEQYTIAKAAENIDWTTKLDDFFPYRDCSACNWAGYYTSRPGVKRLERVSGSTNQLVKQMAAAHLATDTATDAPGIKVAQKAMLKLTAANGVVNHHDAITGTAKQHVTDDWMKTLSDSLAEGESFVGATAASLSGGGGGGAAHALTACRYANESICEPTQTLKVRDPRLSDPPTHIVHSI